MWCINSSICLMKTKPTKPHMHITINKKAHPGVLTRCSHWSSSQNPNIRHRTEQCQWCNTCVLAKGNLLRLCVVSFQTCQRLVGSCQLDLVHDWHFSLCRGSPGQRFEHTWILIYYQTGMMPEPKNTSFIFKLSLTRTFGDVSALQHIVNGTQNIAYMQYFEYHSHLISTPDFRGSMVLFLLPELFSMPKSKAP